MAGNSSLIINSSCSKLASFAACIFPIVLCETNISTNYLVFPILDPFLTPPPFKKILITSSIPFAILAGIFNKDYISLKESNTTFQQKKAPLL